MSKKAVIVVGGNQHIVQKDDEVVVDSVGDVKSLSFDPLMVFDEKGVKLGSPVVEGAKVTADVVESKKGDKVTIMKFQAKKRVKKTQGHRQTLSVLKIKDIKA